MNLSLIYVHSSIWTPEHLSHGIILTQISCPYKYLSNLGACCTKEKLYYQELQYGMQGMHRKCLSATLHQWNLLFVNFSGSSLRKKHPFLHWISTEKNLIICAPLSPVLKGLLSLLRRSEHVVRKGGRLHLMQSVEAPYSCDWEVSPWI